MIFHRPFIDIFIGQIKEKYNLLKNIILFRNLARSVTLLAPLYKLRPYLLSFRGKPSTCSCGHLSFGQHIFEIINTKTVTKFFLNL